MTRVNLNRDLNGVRELALWIFWRNRQKDSNKGPYPLKSLTCSGTIKRANVALAE